MRNLPEWHEKPLELTVEEITDPMSVVSDFFHSYPLPEFREHLRSLLLMACSDQDCNASFNIILCEDIVRLVEAGSVILKRRYGEQNA